MRGIAGDAERHLGEGCLVELLHHAHRDGVECERWFSALDPGRDVLGRGVCLQKGKERLLDGEVARIAGRIDAILAGHSPRSEVGLEEAALVLGQPFVVPRRRRKGETRRFLVLRRCPSSKSTPASSTALTRQLVCPSIPARRTPLTTTSWKLRTKGGDVGGFIASPRRGRSGHGRASASARCPP